ncbi:type VI secretion system baseplate subunit TssF [Pseudomonas sp. LJDD11]|uniref:type VI secretion system baseplate subunit TssF n=1 Tax=Pseudomonas sp. LJDD11 TaxID=2931984 RepID=UPI00211C71A1|nr:type VI secretion system baseplate subunit TssF [Pseudomonas sp. LJDD11]MCQ9422900.1 type VI secretion system baseplate subunit TssF [Pseudomonas sp. LJDD11]
MSDSIDAELLDYYQRELTWLHRAGADFAASHPTLAGHLKLSAAGSQDPHVERLLESFALLTARLQRRLDDGYAEFSDALLEQLYPLALRPMPSCAIARFVPDTSKGNIADGYLLPRATSVFKAPDKSQPDSLYFRTGFDLTLWPVRVEEVTLLDTDRSQSETAINRASSSLCLQLSCSGEKNWAQLPDSLTHLRIHLAGSPINRALLYDLLAAHSLDVVCAVPGGTPQAVNALPAAVGFAEQQSLLPDEDGVHPALRLLVEYFTFPEKFAFFDIPLRIPAQATDRLLVYIAFDTLPSQRVSLQREDIALGCAPIINLFPRTAETLRPDGTRSEHLLVADSHRDSSTEIHSIRSLVSSHNGVIQPVAPFYGDQHGVGDRALFWHARRISGLKAGRPGTDLMLSLVDSEFQPSQEQPGRHFTAKVLCTNRHLAERLAPNSVLKFESSGPVAQIHLLKSPTRQSMPNLAGASRWRLVSQLNLNHTSLVEGPKALASLKEMLVLHNLREDSAVRQQIDCIVGIRTERVVDRVGQDAWRGWRNGLEVRLTLDSKGAAGHSRVLFCAVLANFFALYATTNCFVRTVLVEGDKEIMRWQPESIAGLAL